MGLDGESQENMLRYAEEREQGYVNGEPTGMDPRVPEEASVEFKIMREKAPAPPPEYIGMYLTEDAPFSISFFVFLLRQRPGRKASYLLDTSQNWTPCILCLSRKEREPVLPSWSGEFDWPIVKV